MCPSQRSTAEAEKTLSGRQLESATQPHPLKAFRFARRILDRIEKVVLRLDNGIHSADEWACWSCTESSATAGSTVNFSLTPSPQQILRTNWRFREVYAQSWRDSRHVREAIATMFCGGLVAICADKSRKISAQRRRSCRAGGLRSRLWSRNEHLRDIVSSYLLGHNIELVTR